jgi:hypothetical protein
VPEGKKRGHFTNYILSRARYRRIHFTLQTRQIQCDYSCQQVDLYASRALVSGAIELFIPRSCIVQTRAPRNTAANARDPPRQTPSAFAAECPLHIPHEQPSCKLASRGLDNFHSFSIIHTLYLSHAAPSEALCTRHGRGRGGILVPYPLECQLCNPRLLSRRRRRMEQCREDVPRQFLGKDSHRRTSLLRCTSAFPACEHRGMLHDVAAARGLVMFGERVCAVRWWGKPSLPRIDASINAGAV